MVYSVPLLFFDVYCIILEVIFAGYPSMRLFEKSISNDSVLGELFDVPKSWQTSTSFDGEFCALLADDVFDWDFDSLMSL